MWNRDEFHFPWVLYYFVTVKTLQTKDSSLLLHFKAYKVTVIYYLSINKDQVLFCNNYYLGSDGYKLIIITIANYYSWFNCFMYMNTVSMVNTYGKVLNKIKQLASLPILQM